MSSFSGKAILLFLIHGTIWLGIKSEGELHDRAITTANRLWLVLSIVSVSFLVASKFATPIYDNYIANPILFIFILITVLAIVGVKIFLARESFWKAWFSSAVTILGATFYGFIGLFPNMFPSSLNPEYSLTAHNSASSSLTLTIMLVLAHIFVPIVLAYQIWVYNLFKDKVTKDDLAYEESY
ncbi:MAG: cytochrome d ubiquinol oxidase subunit II [Spirochaetota bacterium]|nr:cytochrome d ubiquinol oxidase subunit II [Spirochaetota bacterium]